MAEIFGTGSEDQVFGADWDADHERPPDDDQPDCDYGHPDCTGRATVIRRTDFMGDVRLCVSCDRAETRRQEDGVLEPPDDRYYDEMNRVRR